MTISEVYCLFKEEYLELTIEKSKFAESRPEEVLLLSHMPRSVCNCQYHSNMLLILEYLRNQLPEIFCLYSELFMKDCLRHQQQEMHVF